MISFGRDSTGDERRAAQKFVLFMLNDYSQNNLTDRAVGNLPANGNVIVPTKESPDLSAMEASLNNAITLPFQAGPASNAATQERLIHLLKQNVYGEWEPERVLTDLKAMGVRRTQP